MYIIQLIEQGKSIILDANDVSVESKDGLKCVKFLKDNQIVAFFRLEYIQYFCKFDTTKDMNKKMLFM